ncbi:MAG: hypothetical protein CLLPBCKN_006324 [Chroococcidiopsis cubana SAG 39.79]|nr:hypothetical protein [Chroococcidiopsis cubana SAG 39.79]
MEVHRLSCIEKYILHQKLGRTFLFYRSWKFFLHPEQFFSGYLHHRCVNNKTACPMLLLISSPQQASHSAQVLILQEFRLILVPFNS